MSKFKTAAVATTMALTIVGTSVATAYAGKKERRRNLALGAIGLLAGAAILNSRRRHYDDNHYDHDCWWEKRRRWSDYHGRYVIRRIKVCD